LAQGPPNPIDLALRALAHRDLSAQELAERLARRGVEEHERADAVERLAQAGYVDDSRFAAGRARVLAERGLGDAAIRADLEQRGVAAAETGDALGALEPEAERARREADRLGGGPRARRALVRRGFAEESLESLFAAEDQLLG
jgi:regulatory protein